MKFLNSEYRGINRTTDVLSFPQLENKHILNKKIYNKEYIILGDIVINIQKALEQSKQYNTSLNNELKRLLIHGLLHLLGYDHEKSSYHKRVMQRKEKDLLEII